MPVEVSIAQVMGLGVLCASVLFLGLLLIVGLYVSRKALTLIGRFQSVGAERVNGRIQMRGLFSEQEESRAVSTKPNGFKRLLKEAVDFEPSTEDMQHVARVERDAAGTGGEVN